MPTLLQFLEPVAKHLDTCRLCQHTDEPCPTASAIFDACVVLAAAAGVHLIPHVERAKAKA